MATSDSSNYDDVMSEVSTSSNISAITTTAIMTTRSMDSNLNDDKQKSKYKFHSATESKPKSKKKSKRKAPLQGQPLFPLETLKQENATMTTLVDQIYRHLKRNTNESTRQAKLIKQELIIQIENLQKQLSSLEAAQHRYQLQKLLALTVSPTSNQEHQEHETFDKEEVSQSSGRENNSTQRQVNMTENKEVENLRMINDIISRDNENLQKELEEMKAERKIKNKVIETLTNIYDDFKIQEKLGASSSGTSKEKENTTVTYAEKVSIPQKAAKLTPQPALLIRTKSNTSISTIRDILHQELKGDSILSKITCLPARDRDLLIVRAEEEKVVDEISNKIQNIQKLNKITELTLKPKNLRKIIILGIPLIIEEDAIHQKLQQMTENNSEITLFKTLKREKLRTYQLVYEVEDFFAKKLLVSGKLLLNFHALKIRQYVPVVRCGRCQDFGHVAMKCKNDTFCQYCAGKHESKSCQYQNYPEEHKCANCHFEFKRTANHAASSSVCPVYKERHAMRNTDINGTFLRSTR